MSGTTTAPAAMNPLISLGTLNRIAGRVVFANFTALNVGPSNLGKRGITLDIAGDITTMIEMMTGQVTSPDPYVPVDVTVPLLRTQTLANSWIAQIAQTSVLGPATIYTDATGFTPYQFSNMAVIKPGPQVFDGTEGTITFTLRGTWIVNNQLWQLS